MDGIKPSDFEALQEAAESADDAKRFSQDAQREYELEPWTDEQRQALEAVFDAVERIIPEIPVERQLEYLAKRAGLMATVDLGGAFCGMEFDLEKESFVHGRRGWSIQEEKGDLIILINKDKNRIICDQTEHAMSIRLVEKEAPLTDPAPTNLRKLCARAAWELREHNVEYKHVTDQTLIDELERFAGPAAVEETRGRRQ